MDRMDWARLLPGWFFPGCAFALGLVFGSFANVCIHRLPRGGSPVRPRSACPGCGTTIQARDNIPLVSWLLLRGRCRHCDAAIPIRYPLVELAGGLLFLALSLRFGPGAGFAVMAAFALSLLILFFTDLETMLLPDAVTLTGTAAGVLLAPWNPLLRDGARSAAGRVVSALLGAAAGAGLVVVILLGWRLWSRRRLGPDATEEERDGMGLGDLKMLALIGAFTGLGQVFFVTFLASVLGSAAGLALILSGRGGGRTAIPFGSFLAVAAVAAMFIGPTAVAWYLSLIGLE
jgi:leader peptidase (prepilin peptidase) / N-methyltransferase